MTLQDIVPELINQGLLAKADGQYAILSVPQKGREFLKSRATLTLTRPILSAGSTTRTSGDGGRYDEGLFSELSALRKRLADDREVPAYVIFGNRSLQDMARKAPRSQEEFSRVSGVGSAKLREFGDTFIETITRYVESKGLPQFYDPVETPFGRKSRPSVSDSARMTGELVSNGSTLEETSEQRGVKRSRVLAHLERLVNEGIEVRFDHLMPSPARRQAIESAFEASGQLLLRPVMDLLGDGYDYEQLRVVRLGIFQKRRANGEIPTHGVPHSGPVRV